MVRDALTPEERARGANLRRMSIDELKMRNPGQGATFEAEQARLDRRAAMQRLDDPYATMSPFSTKDGVTDEGAFNAGVQSRIDWAVDQRALTKDLGKAIPGATGWSSSDHSLDWLADREYEADFGAVLTSVSANMEMVSPTTWEALENADAKATAERVGSPSEHRDKALAALGIESPMSEKDFMEGPLAEPTYWPKPGPQGELASRLLSIVSPAYR